MVSTKLYLDCRSKAKDGKGNVVILLVNNNTSTTIPTGVRISPNDWKNEKVRNLPGFDAINAGLAVKKAKIDKAVALLMLNDNVDSMTAADIKQAIRQPEVKRKAVPSVSELFSEYISNGMKPNTAIIYRQTLGKILSFSKADIKITEINLKWLNQFEKSLSKSNSINSRSIYLRSLRAVCNYAKHTGIITEYPFTNFSIKHGDTLKRCISVEDLRRLRDYPTTERNAMFRDYFFLMFYLVGVNVVDLLTAKPEQIINGRFEYIREKTGKKYSIKIEQEADEILKRYKGSNFLLSALDGCKHYQSFAREINDALKQIGPIEFCEEQDSENLFNTRIIKRVKPIIPEITTYYARHTWATLAYEIGIPIDTISQALGHSFGNRTTLIYVKFDQTKIDDANRKVIDYLNDIK